MHRLLSRFRWLQDLAVGGPFYLFLLLTMVAAYIAVLVTDASIRRAAPLALFSALMLAHTLLHPSSLLLVRHRRWVPAYCLVQGGLAFAIGYLTQSGALIGEMAGILWPNRQAVLALWLFIKAIGV